MNKTDLVKAVAYEAELTQRQADLAVTAVLESITRALSEGDKVVLSGFGSFEVRERAERVHRLPGSNEEVVTPARKVPVFKPGSMLKGYVAR